MKALTPGERTLIMVWYEGGFSYPQIARRLDVPEATARVRLHRAHKRLLGLLNDPS
jgi:DNA-directed RNA polymerase specialized sigma24 family protein